MQFPGRHDHDRVVAQVSLGLAQQRVLQFRAGRLEHGERAFRVVSGPVARETAQGEPREVGRAGGVFGTARGEMAHPARPAHQYVQEPVHVDDLQQLGGAEAAEQFGGAEGTRRGTSVATGP